MAKTMETEARQAAKDDSKKQKEKGEQNKPS